MFVHIYNYSYIYLFATKATALPIRRTAWADRRSGCGGPRSKT